MQPIGFFDDEPKNLFLCTVVKNDQFGHTHHIVCAHITPNVRVPVGKPKHSLYAENIYHSAFMIPFVYDYQAKTLEKPFT